MSFRSRFLNDLIVMGEEMNDPSLLTEVISIFLEQAPLQVEELKKALLENDLPAISFLTHKLRTSAAVVGSKELEALCNSIERQLPDLVADASTLVNQLKSEVVIECGKIQEELNAYLASTKGLQIPPMA